MTRNYRWKVNQNPGGALDYPSTLLGRCQHARSFRLSNKADNPFIHLTRGCRKAAALLVGTRVCLLLSLSACCASGWIDHVARLKCSLA